MIYNRKTVGCDYSFFSRAEQKNLVVRYVFDKFPEPAPP